MFVPSSNSSNHHLTLRDVKEEMNYDIDPTM